MATKQRHTDGVKRDCMPCQNTVHMADVKLKVGVGVPIGGAEKAEFK